MLGVGRAGSHVWSAWRCGGRIHQWKNVRFGCVYVFMYSCIFYYESQLWGVVLSRVVWFCSVSWGRGRRFFLTERIRGVRFACWISEYGPSEEHNPGELCLKDGCGVILRHPSWSGEIALFPPRDNLNLYREYLPEEMKVGQSPRDPEFE